MPLHRGCASKSSTSCSRIREPQAWHLFLSEGVALALWHEDAGTADGISRDADDDTFLALAVTGQATAIISGD